KSYIALAIAAAISVGETPYTRTSRLSANTLYLGVENSPAHVLRPRFDSLGGNPHSFHVLRASSSQSAEGTVRGSVTLSDISLLSEALERTKARLVIVDPIQSYLGATVDSHRSNETRPILDGLATLAEKYGCCILLLRHFCKAQT